MPVPTFYLPLEPISGGTVDLRPTTGNNLPTFTRATTAYTRGAGNTWTQVAAGVARGFYSAEGVYLGYLAEGARTNLCLHSNDFTNAAWTATNMTAAMTATGPDGVSNSASTLTATADNATILQAITSGSASRISSVFIKRRTGSGVINITQDNGSTWTAVTVTGDWTQVSSTNQTLTNPTVGIRIVTNTDAVDVWCFMNEVATFASTPIPTTTGSATRNADVLTYPTTGWFNASAGTLFCQEFHINAPVPAVAICGLSDGTANNRISVNRGNSPAPLFYRVTSGGVASVSASGANNATDGATNKSVMAWQTNDFQADINGLSDLTDTSVVVPTVTALFVGTEINGTGVGCFGPIRRVAYYPTRLSNAQLQALTSGSGDFFPDRGPVGGRAKSAIVRYTVEIDGAKYSFRTEEEAIPFMKRKAEVAVKQVIARKPPVVHRIELPKAPKMSFTDDGPVPHFVTTGSQLLDRIGSELNAQISLAVANPSPSDFDDEDILRLL